MLCLNAELQCSDHLKWIHWGNKLDNQTDKKHCFHAPRSNKEDSVIITEQWIPHLHFVISMFQMFQLCCMLSMIWIEKGAALMAQLELFVHPHQWNRAVIIINLFFSSTLLIILGSPCLDVVDSTGSWTRHTNWGLTSKFQSGGPRSLPVLSGLVWL